MLQKKPIQILNLNVGIIVFSKLVKTKTSSKYLIGTKFDKSYKTTSFDNV